MTPSYHKLLFLFLGLCYWPAAFATPTTIDVHLGTMNSLYVNQHDKRLTFKHHTPRVDEVMIASLTALKQTNNNIDWINTRLYDLSTPDTLPQRVMNILTDQYNLADNNHKYTLQGLIQFIKKSQFAHRVLTPLDPDVTRLHPRKNPKLKGHWLVILKQKRHQNTMTIMGDVFNPGIYQWKNNTDAWSYLRTTENHDNLNEFHPTVDVIQPDGKVEKHDAKQWDDGLFYDIAPGAVIYVPFPIISSSLHPMNTMEDPNRLIIELLRNRIR